MCKGIQIMIEKNLILISYLESLNLGYKLKAEFSTNDDDTKVILVQMNTGVKQILYDGEKIYDYFNIQIFGESIQEQKEYNHQIYLKYKI